MMRRLLSIPLLVVLCALAPAARAQYTIYVSPDVPTEPDTANPPPDFLPWEVIEHVHLSPTPYGLAPLFSLPGNPAISALHKMDRANHWLFSVEAPNGLAGGLGLGVDAEPRDVIMVDISGPAFSFFFDGSCITPPVPPTSNLDAVYLDDGDDKDIIVSYDVPTEIPIGSGAFFQPSELLRYSKTGPGACGWSFAGSEFDFAAIGGYSPAATNVTGADKVGPDWMLALDIPVDLSPPLAATTTPGQIVATDGALWNHTFDDLQLEGTGGWPISSLVDAFSCQANPGMIDPTVNQILMNKVSPNIRVICPASCSSGAELYGLYEGTISSLNLSGVYDHVKRFCDRVCPGNIDFAPPAGSTYYLVVPHNHKEEGSYCTDSGGGQRPQPALSTDRCAVIQTLTNCP